MCFTVAFFVCSFPFLYSLALKQLHPRGRAPRTPHHRPSPYHTPRQMWLSCQRRGNHGFCPVGTNNHQSSDHRSCYLAVGCPSCIIIDWPIAVKSRQMKGEQIPGKWRCFMQEWLQFCDIGTTLKPVKDSFMFTARYRNRRGLLFVLNGTFVRECGRLRRAQRYRQHRRGLGCSS